MASSANRDGWRSSRGWAVMWGAAATLLLVPLAAMRFTDEVDWNAFDFVVLGTLLAAACGAFELAARASGSFAHRAGAGVAVVTALLLIWLNGAVGMIGREDNPANLMYGAVLGLALGGSLWAGFRPSGRARAMGAAALAQLAVAAIALLAGMGALNPPGPAGLLTLNVGFAALWLISAGLFRAARAQGAGQEG